MTSLIETIIPYVSQYGYWAIFWGIFLESLGVPLPGETLIVVGGLYAAKGTLDFRWVVALCIIATFAANNISYAIGYFCGRRFVVKYGKYIFLTEHRIAALEEFIKRHGKKMVIVGRFILGFRQANGLIMGTAKMPWPTFVLFNFIGAILWVMAWAGAAYYFGKILDDAHVAKYFGYYFLLGSLPLIIFIVMTCRFFNKWK